MTMVTVLYFASLREQVGRSREDVALAAGTPTVASLVEQLRAREGGAAEAFAPGRTWRVAVNQQVAAIAGSYLLQMLVYGNLSHFQTYFDQASGTMRSTPITKSGLQKYLEAEPRQVDEEEEFE